MELTGAIWGAVGRCQTIDEKFVAATALDALLPRERVPGYLLKYSKDGLSGMGPGRPGRPGRAHLRHAAAQAQPSSLAEIHVCNALVGFMREYLHCKVNSCGQTPSLHAKAP